MLASTADCSRFRKLGGKRGTSVKTEALGPTGPESVPGPDTHTAAVTWSWKEWAGIQLDPFRKMAFPLMRK